MRKDLDVLKVWESSRHLEWNKPGLGGVMVVWPSDSTDDPVILAPLGTDVDTLTENMGLRADIRIDEARIVVPGGFELGFLKLAEHEGYDRPTELLAWAMWENGVVLYEL